MSIFRKIFSRKEKGDLGEELAAKELKRRGYSILKRNLALGGGEIDILARHDGTLVFVEVKTRRDDEFGTPAEALTGQKAQRLARAVRAYLAHCNPQPEAIRADLVAIKITEDGASPAIEIFTDCLDLAGALEGRKWRR